MTPQEILDGLEADGISLRIDDQGALAFQGKKSCIANWLPKIREHKPELLLLLIERQDQPTGDDPTTKPQEVRHETPEPPPVTVITETSVGKFAVGLEVPDALLAGYAPPKGVMVSFTLTRIDGHGSRRREGRLIEPSGMRSAVHCLRQTYGDRLESINGRPAADVIKEVLRGAS